ncbi:MAG: glycosyltransferase family 39 protein [Ignavibacteriales bacterium]|nr:MAG: glycosyltransferase family 39 protein [Ignavibacteriales bacterium]
MKKDIKKSNKKINKTKSDKFQSERSVPKINLLYVIIVVGFLLRLGLLLEVNNSPFGKTLFSDSQIYFDNAAKMLKNGSFFGAEVFYMSPLYTYLLALLQYIFADAIFMMRLFQVILSTVTIWLIFLTGKNIHSETVGLIAASICAVYSLFIFYSSTVLIETTQTFLIALLVCLLSDVKRLEDKKYWLIAGIVLGLAAILRATVLIFLPAILIWSFYYLRSKQITKSFYYKTALFFVIGSLIPIAPITLQNFIAEKDFVLITSNAGINFQMGNNPDATGIYKLPKEFDLSLDLTGKNFAEKQLNKPLTSAEVSSFWMSKGLNYVSTEPVNSISLYFKKILLFFSEDENAQSVIMDMNFIRKNYSTVLKFTLPWFIVIFYLSLFGFTLHPEKKGSYILMTVLLTGYILSSALFFVIGRFRIPVTPIVMVFAAIGIYELINIIRTKNLAILKLPSLLVVILLLLNFAFTPKFTFNDKDDYLFLGNSYFQKKQYDEAMTYFNKALEINPDASTEVLIANTFAATKDVSNAMMHYRRAVDIDSNYVLAYFNVGVLYTQLASFNDAARAFHKTIEIDKNFLAGYKNLAVIYYMMEDYNKSLFYFEHVLKNSKDVEEMKSVNQDIENIKQKLSGSGG